MQFYVLDHEIWDLIARILHGISVTEETLALDIIDKVGPGGHFLN
jgi:trimethylamine--corrinoid protein Co-methyltransferase